MISLSTSIFRFTQILYIYSQRFLKRQGFDIEFNVFTDFKMQKLF